MRTFTSANRLIPILMLSSQLIQPVGCQAFRTRAQVTIIVLDQRGEMLAFRIESLKSKARGSVRATDDFGSSHVLPTVSPDEIDITVIVKGYENWPLEKKNVLISSPNEFVVIDADFRLGDYNAVAVFSPRAIRVSDELCSNDDTIRWAEIKQVGRARIDRRVRMTGCTLELGKMFPGRYSVVIYDAGTPIAVSSFMSKNSADDQELKLEFARFPRASPPTKQ